MRTKILGLAAFAATAAFTLAPLQADQWDKKTIITINAPMQVPNRVLQPGTYTVKLLESQSNRHIVTIWNEDGTKLITTVLAIPNYRLQPTGDSKFSMWETPAGQPQALRAWFYPGDNFGQEFAYPKTKAAEISTYAKADVPSLGVDDESKFGIREETTTTTTETKTAEVSTPVVTAPAVEPTPEPTPAPAPVAAAPAPTPTPEPTPAAAEPTPAPTPAPAPVAAEQEQPAATTPMPQTASRWVEVMLVGLIAAIAGLSTFAMKTRRDA